MQYGGGMDMTEVIFGLALAALYPTFFGKLSDYMFRDDKAEKTDCWSLNDGNRDACSAARSELIDKSKFKEHVALLIFAIIGIILSGVVSGTSPKFGLGIGGMITLFMALIMYWRHYKELQKLVILGMSFAFIMWLSVRLYSIKSIADIFTMEFGTK